MRNNEIPCLDGFRALAVAGVVAGHTIQELQLPGRSVAWLGFLGVDVFFVISGFLIFGILESDQRRFGSYQPVYFYIRRAFKIMPHYFTVILAAALFAPVAAHPSFPSHFYFMQNYFPSIERLGHLWSISVEEHFYLLLPLLLIVLAQLAPNRKQVLQVTVFALLIVLANIFRASSWQGAGLQSDPASYQMTHFRFDALIFGCLLRIGYENARFKTFIFHPLSRDILFAIGFVIFTFFYFFGRASYDWWEYTAVYVGAGCLIYSALAGSPLIGGLTRWKFLSHIGRSSYGIYLWHWVIILPFAELYARTGHISSAVYYVIAAFTLGMLSTYTVERYFLSFRDRWAALALRPAAALPQT